MHRRNQQRSLSGGTSPLRRRGRKSPPRSRRTYWVERLEERYMLSATPLEIQVAPKLDAAAIAYAQAHQRSQSPGAATLLAAAPFDLEDTFTLHSNPGATKTIYLDFDGHITSGTGWNNSTGLPNITSFGYDTDGDAFNFDDIELESIQLIWEKVAEDFRPFDVDVTTEDPGADALRNTGNGDDEWGTRIVIGGNALDWLQPTLGRDNPGIALLNSFGDDEDNPGFVFSNDLLNDDKFIAEAASHEAGHTLGLQHDGQIRFYEDITPPNPAGFQDAIVEYYAGHGTGATSWAPIMGSSYLAELTQWSINEYWNGRNVPTPAPPNVQDDLTTITSAQNGFGFRTDDHGNDTATADFLLGSSVGSFTTFEDEGIIERTADVDYFTFTVGGLGGIFELDVTPFHNGPNLDVKATIRNSSGAVIATSNPIDDLAAGGQTLALPDGGWELADGTFTDEFLLIKGTYYVTVEGASRPTTFVDPALHPTPPQVDRGNPPVDPLTLMPPDLSDWGYTNYASLGYYSITGTLKEGFVIGVDFDDASGTTPLNWNLFTGGGPSTTLTDLISESGASVPYELTIATSGIEVSTFPSAVDPGSVPDHALPLDELGGYAASEDETWTFTWSDLEPWSYHEIYVFGHADFDAGNVVTITGGNLNGTVQTFNFNQTIDAGELVVNSDAPSNAPLENAAYTVLSDGDGKITITVTNQVGKLAAISGLAIVPTRPIGPAQQGSISGQKWNDGDGNQIHDFNEDGLPDWVVYIDANNNGVLDAITIPGEPDQTLTVASPNVPQPITDYTAVKSELNFTTAGTVEDINVKLDISHTYDSDLHVKLVKLKMNPDGSVATDLNGTPLIDVEVMLFENVGPNGVNFTNTVLDDSALVAIDDSFATAPYTGTFSPQGALSDFIGVSALGIWRLEILDDSLGDTGTLNSWEITVQLAGAPESNEFLEPFQITDIDGNYTFDNLDPGLYNVREFISAEQIADGWQQTWAPPPVTVTSGSDVQGVDFGNWIPAIERGSISGQKYYDANQNGAKDDQEAGLPGWIVYVDTNGNGIRDVAATPTVIPSTDLPKPIVDLNTTTSQITVGTLGTVTNVEVTLSLTHSFVGDLTAYLRSPSGRIVELFTNVGSQYNNFTNLTLSDIAVRSVSTLAFDDLPYTGAYQPEGQLSDFAGEDSAGIWTLILSDTTLADQGTLTSWSLSFTSSELFTTTDANGLYTFDELLAGPYTVREVNQPGWTAIPPATVEIPAATWGNSQWNVVVAASDDPNDPDGPTSKRLVQNVDFGNYGPAGGLQGQVYVDVDGDSSKDPGENGQPGWTVFIDSNGNGTLDLGAIDQTLSSGTASSINGSIVTTSTLWFGSYAKVSDVDVALDITHTYDADVTATLISPAGTRVKLFQNVGGSNDNFTGTSFDDAAATAIGAGAAPFSGNFKPLELLSTFNGENSNGFWTLEIVDNSPADDGTLNSWSLSVLGDEISKVTDATGNYSFSNLVPGNYTLAAVTQDGWTATQVPGVTTVGAAQTTLNVDFGYRITIALEGDFNRDGIVDNSDYIVWRRASGSTVPNFQGADGSGNGIVDQADYDIWRANFGRTLPPPPGSGSGSLVAENSSTTESQQASAATVEASMPVVASADLIAARTGVVVLSSQVSTEVKTVAATDSPSAASNVTFVFAPAVGSTSIGRDAVVAKNESISTSSSDLGLLAWLDALSVDDDDAGLGSLADGDDSADGDDADSVDSAFEEFEGSALALATI